MNPTVLVIAKEPVAGRVKTRLCPPCSPDEAALIARAALTMTLEAVAAVPEIERVLVLDGAPGPWLPPGITVVTQSGGDLADRLAAAFAPHGGPTVLIGMDTPQVTDRELMGAFARLDQQDCDAVLGPTTDGGWWLIGFRTPAPGAFVDVPMSAAITGRAQLARLHALGRATAMLDVHTDVDEFPDAVALAARLPGTPFAAAVEAVARSPLPRAGAHPAPRDRIPRARRVAAGTTAAAR